jgi:hypothetical protein
MIESVTILFGLLPLGELISLLRFHGLGLLEFLLGSSLVLASKDTEDGVELSLLLFREVLVLIFIFFRRDGG